MPNPYTNIITAILAHEDGLKAILEAIQKIPLDDLCELVNELGGVASVDADGVLHEIDADVIEDFLREECSFEFVFESADDVDLDSIDDDVLIQRLRDSGWAVRQEDDLEDISNEDLCAEIARRLG